MRKLLIVVVVIILVVVAAVRFGHLTGDNNNGATHTTDQNPPVDPATTPADTATTPDARTLYPGQVGLRFARDTTASSETVNCDADINLDFVVTTDGRPVQWRAASSDNVNNFIGHRINGVDVSPATGTLQGGETGQFHVSGSPGAVGPFWIGVTGAAGSGATLEVDCA